MDKRLGDLTVGEIRNLIIKVIIALVILDTSLYISHSVVERFYHDSCIAQGKTYTLLAYNTSICK